MWPNFRQVKPDRVIEWMKQLNNDYGAFSFYFADSLLNASTPWLDEFVDKLLKYKLDFQWYGYFRPKIPSKLVQKLKKSGLWRVHVGVETFSQNLLESMEKKRCVDDSLKAIEDFCSSGVLLEISNIVGFPHETKKDFEKKWKKYMQLCKKYPLNIIANTETFQLRPLSRIYGALQDFGLSIKKWDSKTVNTLPEVRDIVREIPMSVTGQPEPQEIIRRNFIMEKSFFLDTDTALEKNLKYNTAFLKKALRYIRFSYKVKLSTRNTYGRPPSIQDLLKKGCFLISRNNRKHVITQEEKVMFDKLDGKTSLSSVAEELSIEFSRGKKKCMDGLLKFLSDLLKKNILFEIIP